MNMKNTDFSSFNLTQLPPNKKKQEQKRPFGLCFRMCFPLMPRAAKVYRTCSWEESDILSKRFSCVMWHVFSWTKTTRRNLEGVRTFKDDNIHILFNVFASFRMDLAASLLTKGQCDAVSHQQRRVPSFTLHVEFDKSRSSVVYRNAPKYTSLSCGYTLPEINIDLLQLLRVVWLLKMLLHIFMTDLEQKMTPMRYTRYTKRGCDCHFAILCLYQSARTREDWETVIDKDCAPLSIGGICGRISQKK